MWLTPAVGAVVALTVNCEELVTLVTVHGAVPELVLVGHGEPSSQPPPGPAGDAVGAAGSERISETSVA
jgi:hypothetical protein